MSAPKDDPAAERRTPAEIAAALCEKASVVGAFDPWAMLAEVAPGLADAAVEDLVLSAVAPQVEEVPEGAEVLWRLRPEPRREVLGGLAARDALKAVIAATRPRALDRFGGYLQSALLTGAATPAAARRHASDADLPLQALALDFAHPIGVQKPAPARAGVTAKPQPLDPRIEIARRAERSRQDYVAPQRLIGRDGEAAALDRYVADGAVIAPLSRLPTPAGAPPRLRPLLLTGIGGSGKSALVADLMRRTQGADWSGPIVVCLDFDQRGIALGGEREWLNEVTRQMGFMRPTLDGPLAVVRSETRQRLDALLKDREGFDRLSGTEGLSVFATMRARLAQVLADDASAPSLARDTLVVVLDTFEEILVRSDLAGPDPEQEPFGLVLAFVDSLARLSGPDGKPILGAVRAVAAGRVAPFADDPARLGQWFEAHNEVGELDLHSAAEFLRLRGSKRIFTPERALRLAGAFPRYPLVLILLVAFARGRTARDLDSLTRGLGPDHLLGTEAATRALYSRFLERLKDHRITDPKTGDDRVVSAADLRRIAHPGLALPVVTPRLIREVLAEPTGLGPIDAARARDLFTALSREVWLVERAAAADAIRHVPALRRIMLPMLNGDVPLAQAADTKLCERVRAVHRAAAAWYRAAGSGEPEARAMAAYHEVFLGEVTALEHDPVLARQVLDVAGDDIYAMPIDARALLRREDVSAAGLSAAETVALPAAERRSAEAARQQRRTKAGVSLRFLGSMPLEAAAPMDSLSTYREAVEAGLAERGGGRRQAEVLADRELAQFVEARFAEADFQGVLAHALPAVIDLVADAGDDPPLDMVGDIVTHWVWKWALSCLATGTGDERLLRWATPAGVRSIGRGGQHDGAVAVLLAATVALGRAPSFAAGEVDRVELAGAGTLPSASRAGPDLRRPLATTSDLRRRSLLRHMAGDLAPSLPASSTIALAPLCLAGLWRRVARRGGAPLDGPAALLTLPAEISEPLRDFAGRPPLMGEVLKLLDYCTRYVDPARLWDRADRRSGEAPLPPELRPAAGLLLRGRMPELNDPVRTALGDVARADPGRLAEAVAELERLAAFWPVDVGADAIADTDLRSREADYLLSQLVIFTDLAGLTGHLFALLEPSSVSGSRFRDVARLVAAYEGLLLAPFDAEGLLPVRA